MHRAECPDRAIAPELYRWPIKRDIRGKPCQDAETFLKLNPNQRLAQAPMRLGPKDRMGLGVIGAGDVELVRVLVDFRISQCRQHRGGDQRPFRKRIPSITRASVRRASKTRST